MDITQTFYDSMATQYDKLFADWAATTREQAQLLEEIFQKYGFDKSASVLDCACGIGTQAIGLAALGFDVTASDFSEKELQEAARRAAEQSVTLSLAHADFRALEKVFSDTFDIVICMDNALPHMLSAGDLKMAVQSIMRRTADGGMFVASIRDYDAMLQEKPPYSPPYIHKTEQGQRICFQVWDWNGDHYRFTQYIIDDEEILQISKFDCEYRAVKREELTTLLHDAGCSEVRWLFPEESGFYQPIVIAKKSKPPV